MPGRSESIANAVIALCAIVIAGSVVTRDVRPAPDGAAASVAGPPQRIERWEALMSAGRSTGPISARVTIAVFDDFECPFCRTMHERVRDLQRRHPADVRLLLFHFPLANHRFARPAARAAECAGAESRFFDMADVLYELQDSLGLKSWRAYAHAAGVTQLARFEACTASGKPDKAIARDLDLGGELGVRATPTVLVNGWMFSMPPGPGELERIVDGLLAGRDMEDLAGARRP